MAALPARRGRIDELRFLVELQVRMARDTTALQGPWQQVGEHCFTQAVALIEQGIAAGSSNGRYGRDPAGFAALYVPDTNTLFGPADALLTRAGAGAAGPCPPARRPGTRA